MVQTALSSPPEKPQPSRLMVASVPRGTDIDRLVDTLAVYAEDILGTDSADAEVLIWTEVAATAFKAEVARAARTKAVQPMMQAIWCPGRLAVIAPPGVIPPPDMTELFEILLDAQGLELDDPKGWRMVVPKPPARAELPLAQVLDAPGKLARANRNKPVQATPEQRFFLDLWRAEQDARTPHPAIAMDPIFLDAPNKDALFAALEALQERHEVLHTSFVTVDGRTYLRLNDQVPVPVERRYHIGATLRSVAALAAKENKRLRAGLQTARLPWRVSVMDRGTSAVVCAVFSPALCDRTSAGLFRDALLAFYDAFRAGENPETGIAKPDRQFIDVAAAPRNIARAEQWWSDLLADQAPHGGASLTHPKKAPVVTRSHSLPPGTDRARLLHAFLHMIVEIDGAWPNWVLVPFHDIRPKGAETMLGQFTRHCPVWFGDMSRDTSAEYLLRRLENTRTNGALTANDLHAHLPQLVPQHFAYAFDDSGLSADLSGLARAEDISLTVSDNTATWSVRLDHPASQHLLTLKRRTLRHLTEAKPVQPIID